ncbi:hypothetical protein C8Q74DRAFT_1162177, partial [Fomes fomentarius]
LVGELNELIANLDIPLPFILETPFDLTPGLLLGILECILQQRLPIPSEIRASRDFGNKVQAMKIFLGVFEIDILEGEDVGLSDIDPRRLASGEEEEVWLVGELLCWLGRRKGILAGPSRVGDRHHVPRRASSPSTHSTTHSTVTSGAHSNLSMMPTFLADTDTTIDSIASEHLAPLPHAELPELPSLPQVAPPPSSEPGRHQPRCIHEVEDPSFALALAVDADVTADASVCHCESMVEPDDLPPTPATPIPHRSEGWIDRADENAELQFYYHPSQAPHLRANHSWGSGSSRRVITPHNSPTEYTQALLNKRAWLLEELAR